MDTIKSFTNPPAHVCENCGGWIDGVSLHLCPNSTTQQLTWSGQTLAFPVITTPNFWSIKNARHELARMDNMGNITFVNDLTLEEAKEAIKYVLEALTKKG